jgi:hypothetical protein
LYGLVIDLQLKLFNVFVRSLLIPELQIKMAAEFHLRAKLDHVCDEERRSVSCLADRNETNSAAQKSVLQRVLCRSCRSFSNLFNDALLNVNRVY